VAEESENKQCPHCGLMVNIQQHGVCRLSAGASTTRALVTEVYDAGFSKAKGRPPKNNQCIKNWPHDTNCYLARGHEGPCRPYPPIPYKERK
jgi:hypothetical protein